MVGAATGRVALFSIHPQYAEAILAGTKTVEFRRQCLPADVTHVVIYATAPVQRVVGVVEVAGIDATSPRRAWSTYNTVGGIDKDAFDVYYDGAASAYVIRVQNPHALSEPFALSEIEQTLRAPQSYMYLRGDLLERTRRLFDGRDRRKRSRDRQFVMGTV